MHGTCRKGAVEIRSLVYIQRAQFMQDIEHLTNVKLHDVGDKAHSKANTLAVGKGLIPMLRRKLCSWCL